jgi:hypothetical protein
VATGRPLPVAGSRTSPHGVGLPSRGLTGPGSGILVARSPHALGARTRLDSGVFPGPASRAPKSTGPLLGLGPPTGFPTGRSGRPVAGSAPPMEFVPLRRRARAGPAHPGLPHPAPSGLRVSTLSPACSLLALPVRGPEPPMGFTLQGLSLRPAAPVSGPLPSCRFRPSLPSPLRTRRSGVPPRLQDVPPAEEPPFPGGRAPLPRRNPRGSPSSSKLSPRRDGPGFPGPPLMRFPVGGHRGDRRRRRSRVSIVGEVRRTLASPPAPLRSAASPARGRDRGRWPELR